MVLPVGFFMPLPLAMMIPFMGIQSAVMAKQFGENFQYGKRRISAMSNEEFNKLTPQKLQENANAELKSMIPSMQQTIVDMHAFQQFLIKEFIDMLTEFIHDMPANLLKILGIDPGILGEHPEIEHPDVPPGVTPPEETNLISFTVQIVNAMSDNTLLHWFNNLHLLTPETAIFVKKEVERRELTDNGTPPAAPSPPQQNTQLHPQFVAGLTVNDLKTGGHRQRMTQWGLMKWEGNAKVNRQHTGGTHQLYEWKTNKWIQVAGGSGTQVQFYNKVNTKWKLTYQASYVLEFQEPNSLIFFIKDDF